MKACLLSLYFAAASALVLGSTATQAADSPTTNPDRNSTTRPAATSQPTTLEATTSIAGMSPKEQYINMRSGRVWREYQKQFDLDGDGKLSQREYQKAFKAWVSEAQELYLKAFDADGDGKISARESQAANEYLKTWARNRTINPRDRDGDGIVSPAEKGRLAAERRKEDLKAARMMELQRFDKNRNGKLDEDEQLEMERYNAIAQENLNEREKERLARWDKDKDGKLSDDERKAMQAAIAAEAQHRYTILVQKADANKDGKVTTEEIKAFQLKLLEKYDADHDGKLSKEEADRLNQVEFAPDSTTSPAATQP